MNPKTRKLLTILLSLGLVIGLAGSLFSLLQDRAGGASYSEAEQTAGLAQQKDPPQTETVPPVIADPVMQELAKTDLAALRTVNEDVLGWIHIPDTVISYPIVQGEDNDFYLRRTWQKEQNTAGCIFLDSEVSPDFSDFSTIIYGHRMRNETMFGALKYYEDPAYYAAHPSVYIVTETSVRRYDVFAAYETEVTTITYGLGISSETVKQEFLDFAFARSVIETEIEVNTQDHILTMSTCPALGYSTRWVVQAVLAEETTLRELQ